MDIRRVRRNEGDLLRELRIRMVSDSPDAFNDTIETVLARPQSVWDASATHFAEADDGIYYIAEDSEKASGTLECSILPNPVLSREQVQTIVRVMGGAELREQDEQKLGKKLSDVLQANASHDITSNIAALTSAGVTFVDMIRILILMAGPTVQAASDWDCDSLILPGQTAFLRDMWVAPSSRGNGLGQKLIETAVPWAHMHGACRVSLFVTETQASAIRLYERTGFTATGHRIRMPHNPRLYIHAMTKEL